MTPFQDALKKHAGKTIRAVDLSSAEWISLPAAFRDRSLFSARTANAWYVQQLKDTIASMLNPQTVDRDGRPVTDGLDLASARLQLKDALRAISYAPAPGEIGTIKDLSSDPRLNLILRQNTNSAQGYGWHAQGQDPDLLDQWPAQELYRAEDRKEPRNWTVRWNGARGKLGASTAALDARVRMVAPKNDPIWRELSAFGVPWPPFDFNSGMDVRDISRAEAEQLGVIQAGQKIEPDSGDLNDGMQSSAAGLDQEFLDRITREFGGEISVDGDTIRWTPSDSRPVDAPVDPMVEAPPAASPFRSALESIERKLENRKGSERMVVLRPDGSVAIDRVGGKSGVGFTSADYPAMKDAVITHNHPRGTSFSVEDIRSSQRVDCQEIRAVGVGHSYTYSLIRPNFGWPPNMTAEYIEIDADVLMDFARQIHSGKMTIEQAQATHAHEVMVRLSKKLNLKYERSERTKPNA